MNKTTFFRKAMVAACLAFALASFCTPVVFAQGAQLTPAEQDTLEAQKAKWHYLGAALGLGMIVMGAAFGIGKFTAAAAEGIARQPAAAAQISGAVNLPLFLLEGVAIIAEVVVLLIVLLH